MHRTSDKKRHLAEPIIQAKCCFTSDLLDARFTSTASLGVRSYIYTVTSINAKIASEPNRQAFVLGRFECVWSRKLRYWKYYSLRDAFNEKFYLNLCVQIKTKDTNLMTKHWDKYLMILCLVKNNALQNYLIKSSITLKNPFHIADARCELNLDRNFLVTFSAK